MTEATAKILTGYLHAIERELAAGNATEHTHRPALKMLVEGLVKGVTATNEPQRIECGAPDFLVTKGAFQIGYMEAKDVGKSLDEAEKSVQLKRYLSSLPNIVLTDYLGFRWYVDGGRRLSARLGTAAKDGRIKPDKAGLQAVAELLNDFLAHKAEAVGTPKELARQMARLAHRLRELVTAAFQKKLNLPSLNNLYQAFCDTLVPDLTTEQFADMYAQTIAYGLFAARCNSPNGTTFTRQDARDLVPKTNPFLRNIFDHIVGAGLPEIIAPEVDDLVQLLAQADMSSILKDFGKRTAKEDPVVHFYETFLAQYDPRVRKIRGVYYTPEPVVSYIVRSIDYLLKTRFNKPQGLADDKTLILDPAVGTATFLYTIVNEIHEVMVGQKQKGMWNDYVADKLLPRIFGFELLMAPYAVAHLKLGLLLQETDYQFKSDQRLGIYLTNTLEEAIKHSEVLFARWISEEANAAAQIKKEKPIMVVLGNPPYSGISANASTEQERIKAGARYKKRLGGRWEWVTAKRSLIATVPNFIGELLDDYYQVDGKPLGEKNPKWLQNDYVKFIRFGQWRIERTGQGILGFITDHSYLDNPTFRGMRQSLMNSFTDIYILNLHGNIRKKKVAPDGGRDQNVFDIQQGVAIGLFIKELGKSGQAKVHYADLWGLRGKWPNPQPGTKYHALSETDISTTDWAEVTPSSPFYLFVPVQGNLLNEYQKGWKITEILPINTMGIQTHRDHLVIDFDIDRLQERIDLIRQGKISDDTIMERFDLKETGEWSLPSARAMLIRDASWQEDFVRCTYRPFDVRSFFYHEAFVDRPRLQVMRNILHGSKALLLPRGVGGTWQHAFVTSHLVVDVAISAASREANQVFPLYVYPSEGEMQFKEGRRPNLNPEFVKALSERLGLKSVEDGNGDLKETFGPEDIFNYAYAIFYSPTYRSRYAELLKIDFPRLPLTSDKGLFKALADKGAALVSLHLMESPVLEGLRTRIKFDVSGSNAVEKVTYNETARRVYINKEQHFEGVPPEVWGFHIGGYQVCQKWLKDRKGRTLTYDERVHYQKIVVAIKETIRLMAEIDTLISAWPIE